MIFNYLANDWNKLDKSWQDFFAASCADILEIIDQQLSIIAENSIIYPPQGKIFNSLSQLSLKQIKVIIIGQDPYHGENEANGLAFAVDKKIKLPPSLRNIFKELILEYNPILTNFDGSLLESWKSQGVLLLNSTLTVIKDQANSLAKIGWQTVTDAIIAKISQENKNCVFILWGNYARNKKPLIDSNKHLILEGVHPSPLSANRGFFGCKHFKLTNEYFEKHNLSTIDWLKQE